MIPSQRSPKPCLMLHTSLVIQTTGAKVIAWTGLECEALLSYVQLPIPQRIMPPNNDLCFILPTGDTTGSQSTDADPRCAWPDPGSVVA